MIFLVLADDRAGALEHRLALRPSHLEYWERQGETLKLAGARLDGDSPSGSFFVIEAADEAAVRALVDADPFTVEGVYAGGIRIQPVRPSLGTWRPAV